MIRLTCPECHSRCRLKNNQTNHTFSYGRCPACGHRFLLPLVDEQPGSSKTDPLKSRPGRRKHSTVTWLKLIKTKAPPLVKNPLFISSAGLILAFLLLVIFLNSNRQVTPETIATNKARPEITKNQPRTVPELNLKPVTKEIAKFKLEPKVKARAITQIKHHALVADADINLHDRQLQLALLVTGNTPINYSERLGYQFANYVKELIPKEQPQPAIIVSVYYPDGTRIEVTTKDHSPEEEVILNMEHEE